MLTERALRERKWGQFPILRQALENEKVPANYYGNTSVSDNIFNRLERLIEIAILVREYKDNIRNTAQSLGTHKICNDLQNLEQELENSTRFIRDLMDNIRREIRDNYFEDQK